MSAIAERAGLTGVSREAWRALGAAHLGWLLDGMDMILFAFAVPEIQKEFAQSAAGVGSLFSVTLFAASVGGVFFGVLADRIGRARTLMLSILMYSVFTGLTATATSVWQLALWRALTGIGLGGEWPAGAALVSETWPARHRGKAIGLMQSGWALGYIAAALLSAAILPRFGWRALFLAGLLPAFATVWIRKHVAEPAVWTASHGAREKAARTPLGLILRPPYLSRVAAASLLATALLFAYWGLFSWLPAFLSSPVAKGGAGLGIVRSTAWIVPMQLGAFAGYLSFGFLADRFGRRPVFLFFVLACAVLVPAYGLMARQELVLLALGPLVGFFGHGYFSLFGAQLAELFPLSARATAQGLCYNAGRAVSALAPFTIGLLAGRYGLGTALASTAACYLAAGVVIWALPETRGAELE